MFKDHLTAYVISVKLLLYWQDIILSVPKHDMSIKIIKTG